jgi:hypothetical protein
MQLGVQFALDLANHPERLETWAIYLKLKLKIGHKNFPKHARFDLEDGYVVKLSDLTGRYGPPPGLKTNPEDIGRERELLKARGMLGFGYALVTFGR